MAPERPHVVIIGGGFGGLAAAKTLERAPVDVTLLDRSNHHLFQPLLYQVATAALAAPDIAEPIRAILSRQDNVKVRLASVTGVQPEARQVLLDSGDAVPYDFLVVATGATHSYFGNDAWAPYAPGLKTLDDALRIREHLLHAFEQAEWTEDPEERQRLLTFVVIGGGPTGVEMAGALAEITVETLRGDYRNIDTTEARVVLIEASHKVLGVYDDPLPDKALRQLRDLGVEVRLGSPVTHVDANGVRIGEEHIDAGTVLWAAGVKASPIGKALGAPVDRAGRVVVAPDLSVPGHPEIFVVGDLASFSHTEDGKPLPGLAPVAQAMGRHAATVIRDQLRGRERPDFRYTDRGSMATIGRSKAIAQTMGLKLSGFVAWLMWVFIHLAFLVEFRNRLIVLLKWGFAWLTWDRSSRVFTHSQVVDDEQRAREARAS